LAGIHVPVEGLALAVEITLLPLSLLFKGFNMRLSALAGIFCKKSVYGAMGEKQPP